MFIDFPEGIGGMGEGVDIHRADKHETNNSSLERKRMGKNQHVEKRLWMCMGERTRS